jgi:proline iminopeptidase
MISLFPEISINHEYRLKVDDLHELYLEESGKADGIPVLFLHDGPSTGANPYYRRLFDAECYRIIQFDSRGSGRSTPYAELTQNNPELLLKDVSAVCEFLDIKKALFAGSGFGANLALQFAAHHPEKVLGLLLVNLADYSARRLEWLLGRGVNQIFPDLWLEFEKKAAIGSDLKGDSQAILQDLHRKLTGENELIQMQAARAWIEWVFGVASFHPDNKRIKALSHSHNALSVAKIQTYYFLHQINQTVQDLNLTELSVSVPKVMIHGRYNMVSPMQYAVEIQNQLEESELQIIRDAGHSLGSAAICDAVVRMTNAFASQFGPELA